LLDAKLIYPGSSLIYIGAYDPKLIGDHDHKRATLEKCRSSARVGIFIFNLSKKVKIHKSFTD